MSASGIREFFFLTNSFISVPESSSSIYKNEIASGAILDKELAQRFLYMSVLRSSPEKISNAFDCPEGCGYFIYDLAKKSESADQFFKNLSSKSYTFARLRRVVMNLVFGVENVSKDIGFTTLLCSDKNGCELLKSIRKNEKIKVITKQSDAKNLKDDDMLSFKLGRGVDEAFYALLKKSQSPDTAYKKSAIII
jgi:predicted nucleotidyltransferase